jgi:hypothetical protein
MKRFSVGALTAVLIAGAAGCASEGGFETMSVTKSPSVVQGCEKVADITVLPTTLDPDTATQLRRQARRRGANTLLVAADDAASGTAYRCGTPSVTASSGASAPKAQ